MTLEPFNGLKERDQMNLLIVAGKMPVETDQKTNRKGVYLLYGFYVTVSFQADTGNVLRIASGSDLNVLQSMRNRL